jgi:transcriptional regulator with XRE-family HTH domain
MVNPITLKIRAKKLGVLIKDARLAAGKSMKDCGRAIGISSTRIGNFESGKQSPSLPELESLAFFLNTPFDHFWGQDSRSTDIEERVTSIDLERLVSIRTKAVGVLLSKTRTDAGMSLKELAASVGITPRRLKSYESGDNHIPLPELEGMAEHIKIPIDFFRDADGVVGKWAGQQMVIQQFLDLSPEMQEFVVKPVNLPYLEIAQRLSGMSVEKLRTMAEGLLDITL